MTTVSLKEQIAEVGRDRPILFSAPMVRALLEGQKTMTRRVMPFQPTRPGAFTGGPWVEGDWVWPLAQGTGIVSGKPGPHPEWVEKHLKYAVGDRLWVRESFSPDWADHGPIYRADGGSAREAGYAKEPKWKPGIHMPRTASRLTLTVTGVKVERLQEISATDAEAEGVFRHVAEYSLDKIFRSERSTTAIQYFRELWQSIHGPGAWEANPFVCAVTFTIEQRNIDTKAAA